MFTASVHGDLQPATRGRVLRAVAPRPAPLPARLRADPLARRPPLAAPPARGPSTPAPGPERNGIRMTPPSEPRGHRHLRPAARRRRRTACAGEIAREVVKRILRGVPVTARLATGEVYGAPLAGTAPAARGRPRRTRSSRGSAHSPMIGLGEAYMAREWSAAAGTDLADALAPFAERLTDLIKPVFYRLRHTVLPRGLNPGEHQGRRQEEHRGALRPVQRDVPAVPRPVAVLLLRAVRLRSTPRPALADLEAAQLAQDRRDPRRRRRRRRAPGCSRSAPAGARWPSGPPSAAPR